MKPFVITAWWFWPGAAGRVIEEILAPDDEEASKIFERHRTRVGRKQPSSGPARRDDLEPEWIRYSVISEGKAPDFLSAMVPAYIRPGVNPESMLDDMVDPNMRAAMQNDWSHQPPSLVPDEWGPSAAYPYQYAVVGEAADDNLPFVQLVWAQHVPHAVSIVANWLSEQHDLHGSDVRIWSVTESQRPGHLKAYESVGKEAGKGGSPGSKPLTWTAGEYQSVLLLTPARDTVPAALQAINRYRRKIGQRPLDPVASGWTDQDILDEVARLRLPNRTRQLARSLVQ